MCPEEPGDDVFVTAVLQAFHWYNIKWRRYGCARGKQHCDNVFIAHPTCKNER